MRIVVIKILPYFDINYFLLNSGSKYTMKDMIQLWREELACKREQVISLDTMKIIDDRGIIGRRHEEGHKSNKLLVCDSVIGNFRKLELD